MVESYKSSVLTCYVGDNHCAVCNYLDGDDREETLIEVIRILDLSLAECEKAERALLRGVTSSFSVRIEENTDQ